MKKYLLFILLPLLLNSCKNNSETKNSETETAVNKFEKIDQLQWLLGTWTNESGEEFSQETWSRENESSFTAFSFTQVGKETVFAETMALEQKGENLFLAVVTVNQNNENPVTFKMVSSENGQFTFENKDHDFPERITYSNPVKDSLHAWIEGTVNGEAKKVDFYFSRKNR
ncbi:DUF6265 family protein [Aequorivita lipolytica]|uniref:DUF6265 domain-containing protein n=1 Tax=Aequorivita lipolytica TaxID=153267 RepID=A0A5C6YLW1_9FLAO|nr:DUF6265 family protein [Aequorivita lipolytica]TXD68331.1 hypothetical protein ESV24_12765 [Aequorivita lipolytica]SRX53398.1 hypothetical protein AEQU2_02628 [Aequorivita lipolytica]